MSTLSLTYESGRTNKIRDQRLRAEQRSIMAEQADGSPPHVLLFPFPIQGHMPPMLKLAQLLSSSSSANFFVTFVNTHYSHRRFLRHSPALHLLARQLPNFRFRTIPDGLPDDDPRPFLQFMQLEESLRTRSREAYRELLVPASGRDPDGWPPVTCVVADAVASLAFEVAEEVEVPVMIFRTSSACSFWVFRCAQQLISRGELPFPENADLDELIQGVGGTESFFRRRDLPSFCRDLKSPGDPLLQILTRVTDNASRARALIINTFEDLEAPMLSRIRSFCPVTYPIGPIHILESNSSAESTAASVNLWQEDRDCMAWLDSQPPRSVLYVSFGSIAVVSREQATELLHGLLDSDHKFLWVVRQDMVMPPELRMGAGERGCLASWAPQAEVLAHPAVGCFLTHSGWNSTLESIVAGVPVICWPFMTDQQVNSRFTSQVWRIGVDMKDESCRSVVEKMVRDVMTGEEAEELRTSVGAMAAKARASVEEGGSSYLNLMKLIHHIKDLSSKQAPCNPDPQDSRDP